MEISSLTCAKTDGSLQSSNTAKQQKSPLQKCLNLGGDYNHWPQISLLEKKQLLEIP